MTIILRGLQPPSKIERKGVYHLSTGMQPAKTRASSKASLLILKVLSTEMRAIMELLWAHRFKAGCVDGKSGNKAMKSLVIMIGTTIVYILLSVILWTLP